MVLKVKMFGKTTQIRNQGQYWGIGIKDITMGVIIAKAIVEAVDGIVEAFGFIFKEECLEKRVKSCALGNSNS